MAKSSKRSHTLDAPINTDSQQLEDTKTSANTTPMLLNGINDPIQIQTQQKKAERPIENKKFVLKHYGTSMDLNQQKCASSLSLDARYNGR